jgi:dynactin 1
MRQTIEDLEALKDLNDELEENHIESEKQLSGEIGKLPTPFGAQLTFRYLDCSPSR